MLAPPRPPETLAEQVLPLPLRRFPGAVPRRAFWDCHEALENAWRASGSDFYQALILYACLSAPSPSSADPVGALPLSLSADRMREGMKWNWRPEERKARA